MKLGSLFRRRNRGYQHINPDGSQGGFIPSGAHVSPEAYVGKTAVVLEGSTVGAGARIESGEIVIPGGRVVRFGETKARELSPA